MKITGTQTSQIQLDISNQELADVFMQFILDKIGLDEDFDDAGCDWFTSNTKKTYVGGSDWKVSDNFMIAQLVDSYNIIRYGEIRKISEEGE